MKQENIQQSGIVLEELGNSLFKVKLENGIEIICTISGKIRKNYIRIMAGDKVDLEVSPYDLTKGRITRRHNQPNANPVNNSINQLNNKRNVK